MGWRWIFVDFLNPTKCSLEAPRRHEAEGLPPGPWVWLCPSSEENMAVILRTLTPSVSPQMLPAAPPCRQGSGGDPGCPQPGSYMCKAQGGAAALHLQWPCVNQSCALASWPPEHPHIRVLHSLGIQGYSPGPWHHTPAAHCSTMSVHGREVATGPNLLTLASQPSLPVCCVLLPGRALASQAQCCPWCTHATPGLQQPPGSVSSPSS